MGNSWKYAQILQFPQSNLCECGHYRKDHHRKNNGTSSFCYKCMDHGKLTDITASPPDDVFDFLVGKREKCEKFRKWSVKRVRDFWEVANTFLWVKTNTEQTILDDYYKASNNHGYCP